MCENYHPIGVVNYSIYSVRATSDEGSNEKGTTWILQCTFLVLY